MGASDWLSIRWRFPDASNAGENSARATVLRRMDGFWKAYSGKAAEIDAEPGDSIARGLVDWMRRELDLIDPRLVWEVGPARRGGRRRLVITPESDRFLRPMVETLVSRAPSLPGWEFYAYRPADPLDDAIVVVKARTGGTLSRAGFRAQIGKHHLVNLEFRGMDLDTAFAASEVLVGEEVLDKWIGEIRVVKKGLMGRLLAGSGYQPLNGLKEVVDRLVRELQARRPDQALFHRFAPGAPEQSYTVIEGEKPQQDDYAGKDDMFVGISAAPEITIASQESMFYSERFSRHSEVFGYLKIEWPTGSKQVSERARISEPLNAELAANGLGCVFAEGTGYRYMYIDLALVNVQAALPIVRRVLQSANASRRSWLLFLDADLRGEWVGAWPDTPAPPPFRTD